MFGIFKKYRRPSGHFDYASPEDRLISLWLAMAKAEGATALIFGMPHDRRSSDAFSQPEDGPTFDPPLVFTPKEEAARQALADSSRLKSAAGWQSVPTWLRINGELRPMMGAPIALYFTLLSKLQERLLSLDASEDAPKPMRYIEYDSPDSARRCFAEVELFLDDDNTTRLEIAKHVEMPVSVRAIPSVR